MSIKRMPKIGLNTNKIVEYSYNYFIGSYPILWLPLNKSQFTTAQMYLINIEDWPGMGSSILSTSTAKKTFL